MSEVITQFHRETYVAKFWKTPEGSPPKRTSRGCTWGRPACGPPPSISQMLWWFPLTPRLHLHRSLSRFDPRTHVVSSGLYKQTPAPLRHKSCEKIETLIILRAPLVSRAYVVRLRLEGGKQIFAWIPDIVKSVVRYNLCTSLSLYLYYFYMLATIVTTILVFILFMFKVAMFIIYFDYIISTTGLLLCLCICLYGAYSKVHGVGGRDHVSVVLICYLPANTLYIPSHVVDRRCDTTVESFVVHSPNIGHRSRIRLRRKGNLCS
jgi:hypothetical protein